MKYITPEMDICGLDAEYIITDIVVGSPNSTESNGSETDIGNLGDSGIW